MSAAHKSGSTTPIANTGVFCIRLNAITASGVVKIPSPPPKPAFERPTRKIPSPAMPNVVRSNPPHTLFFSRCQDRFEIRRLLFARYYADLDLPEARRL